MRTYLLLKDKARQFRQDREIQALLAEIRGDGRDGPPPSYSRDARDAAQTARVRSAGPGGQTLPYERLDQLVIDLLLGARE